MLFKTNAPIMGLYINPQKLHWAILRYRRQKFDCLAIQTIHSKQALLNQDGYYQQTALAECLDDQNINSKLAVVLAIEDAWVQETKLELTPPIITTLSVALY